MNPTKLWKWLRKYFRAQLLGQGRQLLNCVFDELVTKHAGRTCLGLTLGGVIWQASLFLTHINGLTLLAYVGLLFSLLLGLLIVQIADRLLRLPWRRRPSTLHKYIDMLVMIDMANLPEPIKAERTDEVIRTAIRVELGASDDDSRGDGPAHGKGDDAPE